MSVDGGRCGRSEMGSAEQVWAHLNSLHEAVWELAAIALALRDPAMTDLEQRRAAEQVLVEDGLMMRSANGAHLARGVTEAAGGDEARLAAPAGAGLLAAAGRRAGAEKGADPSDRAVVGPGRGD